MMPPFVACARAVSPTRTRYSVRGAKWWNGESETAVRVRIASEPGGGEGKLIMRTIARRCDRMKTVGHGLICGQQE